MGPPETSIVIREAAAAPAPVPSFKIGPSSGYLPSGTQEPTLQTTLTGNNVAVETGNAGDFYVYLSPDVQSKVADAIKQNCANAPDTQCKEAVVAAIDNNSVNLQARAVPGPIIGAILVALVGIIVGQYRKADAAAFPSVVHLPSSDVAQVSALATVTATQMAIDEGSAVYTITRAPDSTTATGPVPSVTTVTGSINNHAAGDVMIAMPSGLADRAQAVISGVICRRNQKKRAVDLGCVVDAAQNIALNAQAGLALHDLVLIQGRFPQFQAVDVVRAMNQAIDFARQLAPAFRVDAATAGAFGVVTFALAYHVLVEGGNLDSQIYFPSSDLAQGSITSGPTASSATSNSRCATTPIICQDNDCEGKVPTRTCLSSTNSGCSCTPMGTFGPGYLYDTDFAMDQAKTINAIISGRVLVTPSCSINSDGPNFSGAAAGFPATWCVCTQTENSYPSSSSSPGLYSTLPSKTGPDACAYTELPNSTISISHASTTPSATSCRPGTTTFTSDAYGFTSGQVFSSCTCNDNAQHGLLTTSSGTSTIHYCPDETPTFPAPPPPTTPPQPPSAFKCPDQNAPVGQIPCDKTCPGENQWDCNNYDPAFCYCTVDPCKKMFCYNPKMLPGQ